jgi:hypothetical protein
MYCIVKGRDVNGVMVLWCYGVMSAGLVFIVKMKCQELRVLGTLHSSQSDH